MSALTICSVSFYSAAYLKLNWELTRKLNRADNWSWIVVDNSPTRDEESFYNHNKFVVMNGIPNTYTGFGSASYHHGLGLNEALKYVNTRFAIFLDPDFYIVRKGWIEEVTDHMLSRKLAFFGAPYHPKWYLKYRYFPCAHCLFIDMEKVARESIDFRPAFDVTKTVKRKERESPRRRSPIKKLVRQLQFKKRRRIGSSRDTGYSVYRRYGLEGKLPYECVLPVFRPELDCDVPFTLSSRIGTLLDKLLPDHLSYTPSRPGYYSRDGFREHGYPDLSSRRWEEFMWKGLPFGFHLRGYGQAQSDMEVEKVFLEQLIAALVSRDFERKGHSDAPAP